jgi:hypothetical protein
MSARLFASTPSRVARWSREPKLAFVVGEMIEERKPTHLTLEGRPRERK